MYDKIYTGKKNKKREWRNVNMSFMDDLQKEMDRVNQDNGNNEDVDSPYKHLKHDSLYFDKNNRNFIVRILPPVNGGFFAKEFKELFLKATNKNGKELKSMVTIASEATPDNNELMRDLLTWQQQGLVPDNYGNQAKPTKRYYVNAVKVLADGQGNIFMETDQQGNLVVRLMKLPTSAYQQILSKLADPMLQPNGETEYGFIGINNAFPINITKPAPGSMQYGVDVYSNKELGALPQGWEQNVEDLNYQATPTEEYDHTYLPMIRDILNGNEGASSNQGGNSGGQTQPTQQSQGNTQAPTQNQNQFQNATTQQNQFQNTQQQQAPQQNFNQAPQQNQQQNQAPQQNFNQAPQQTQQQTPPPQQTQQQAPPVQGNNDWSPQASQQQQQSQQQTPPPVQENNSPSGTQSVDDVLGKLKQGYNRQ